MNEEEFLCRKFERLTFSYKIDDRRFASFTTGKFFLATKPSSDSAKILEDLDVYYGADYSDLHELQGACIRFESYINGHYVSISFIGFLQDVMKSARKIELQVEVWAKDGYFSNYWMFQHYNNEILSTLRKEVRQIEEAD